MIRQRVIGSSEGYIFHLTESRTMVIEDLRVPETPLWDELQRFDEERKLQQKQHPIDDPKDGVEPTPQQKKENHPGRSGKDGQPRIGAIAVGLIGARHIEDPEQHQNHSRKGRPDRILCWAYPDQL